VSILRHHHHHHHHHHHWSHSPEAVATARRVDLSWAWCRASKAEVLMSEQNVVNPSGMTSTTRSCQGEHQYVFWRFLTARQLTKRRRPRSQWNYFQIIRNDCDVRTLMSASINTVRRTTYNNVIDKLLSLVGQVSFAEGTAATAAPHVVTSFSMNWHVTVDIILLNWTWHGKRNRQRDSWRTWRFELTLQRTCAVYIVQNCRLMYQNDHFIVKPL